MQKAGYFLNKGMNQIWQITYTYIAFTGIPASIENKTKPQWEYL
jgi:hypothetical protein